MEISLGADGGSSSVLVVVLHQGWHPDVDDGHWWGLASNDFSYSRSLR